MILGRTWLSFINVAPIVVVQDLATFTASLKVRETDGQMGILCVDEALPTPDPRQVVLFRVLGAITAKCTENNMRIN